MLAGCPWRATRSLTTAPASWSGLREGLDLAGLARPGEETTADGTPRRLAPVVGALMSQGLLEPAAALRGRAVLTLRGRLMADTVTGRLTD